jgi:hypothetical protein
MNRLTDNDKNFGPLTLAKWSKTFSAYINADDDEYRCEDVRDKCAVCGKSCKLVDLVWDKYRNKVVCYDCDTETQASNVEVSEAAGRKD